MNQGNHKFSFGWVPDFPSIKDFTVDSETLPERVASLGKKNSVKDMLQKAHALELVEDLPTKVDLRKWCSPIEDQEDIGSCTAHAGVGIIEYFERRAFNKHIDASRLFLYKVTRNLMHWKGDTGAYLRSAMGAMTLFGVPPEEYYPYVTKNFDKEPSAFCYAFAQNYQSIQYYRLDAIGTTKEVLLKRIKTNLSAGLPSMFGFTCYSSLDQADETGKIPFPTKPESVEGGHAIDAVGYDDTMKIKNLLPGGKETVGALLIRNSWGTEWGEKGYGWLPYEYVLKGLAVDWWSLLKNEWIDTGMFTLEENA